MLDVNTITAHSLEKTINDELSNPTYTQNVKATQALVNDHMVEPKQQFMYWVKYVIRHNAAKHLINDFVHNLSVIEFWSLDVYFVIFTVVTLVCAVIFTLLIYIYKIITRKFFKKAKQE